MTTFRVGMKVVCVDAAEHLERVPPLGFKWAGDMDGLTEGQVYTIRSIYSHPVTGKIGIELNEIVRAHIAAAADHMTGFAAWRFRPVAYPKQSAEQDVAIFLHIANHIDPIIRADEYRQEMEESEARLERLWTAMRSFEL
jgi:hypothetical protein